MVLNWQIKMYAYIKNVKGHFVMCGFALNILQQLYEEIKADLVRISASYMKEKEKDCVGR